MSWLSELFGGGGSAGAVVPPTAEQVGNYYRQVKANNPAYYEQIKQSDPEWIAAQSAPAPAPAPDPGPAPAPAPTPFDPAVSLQKLNEGLGSGFESRLLPDTLDDPFVNTALTKGRGTADEFISNMLRRGTLSDTGGIKARASLDKQTPGATNKLNDISMALLNADRGKLTNLANAKRAGAQQAGPSYDPSGDINEINTTGQGFAGSFGDRFNAALPAGDLYDVSGLGAAGGGVTSPQNVQYDPYAQEGGKLNTGLQATGGEQAAPTKKKRTTAVF